MCSSTATVLVAAAPALQRQGLLATLREVRPDLFLSTTANARTLPARVRYEAPALLIVDVSLPGPGLTDLLGQVRAARPRLLVLGGRRLPLGLPRYLVGLGAGALLARQTTPAGVVAAVERLLAPAAAPQPRPAPAPPQLPPGNALSPRELEILHLIGQDYSSGKIAARLFISVRTVDAHRRALLQKIGARTSVGLVLHAVRQGWLETPDFVNIPTLFSARPCRTACPHRGGARQLRRRLAAALRPQPARCAFR